jgi:signal transduction histidine kinase
VSRQELDRIIPRQLRVAAVGQITAGIIHDANNALAVVLWNLERSARSLAPASKEAESAKIAMNSAMKAAALLQRVLEYAGHGSYDPGLVNLAEMLSRLFVTASASIETDIRIVCEDSAGVGPVIIDETLLELSLLDLVATLAREMAKDGSITLKAADLPSDEAPPADAPNAKILLSLDCVGLAKERAPPLRATLLQHFTELAGGSLTLSALPNDRCEIRLYLPRAIASSGDGTVFT